MKSAKISIFKLTAFLIASLLLLFIPALRADNHNAASLSPADIQAAVNAASPGDYVILPAGNYSGFNSTVDIPNGISVKGQGRDITIIRKTSTVNSIMLRFNNAGQASAYQAEISDFSLHGRGDQATLDTGIDIAQGMKNFKIHDLTLQGFGYTGARVHGYSYGVIWNCRFLDCYAPGYGYGVGVTAEEPGDVKPGDAAWARPLVLGGNEWVFVEDCYFSNQRHVIASNYGARYVFRYNTCVNNKRTEFIDVHGYSGTARGGRAWEVYHNSLTGDPVNWPDGIGMTGGDGVVFNNTMQTNIAFPIYLADDSCEGSYPGPDQMRSCYIWGNTEDGYQVNRVGSGSNHDIAVYCTQFLLENRDFFLYPMPGYTPYTYPHPLRLGSASAHISLSKTSLTFAATAGGSKPASQAFQVSNSGAGTLNWTITESSGWLSCSPTSGQGNASITVNADQAGLSAGTYNANISVSASNADNSPQSVTVSLTVTSSSTPLQASVIASPASGPAPLTTSFSGSATGGTPPYGYSWSFGDGSSSSVQNPSHTYSSAGNYTATLTVNDSKSVSDSESINIAVSSAPAPLSAAASASPLSGTAPLTTSFSGSATGGTPPYSYSWSFGDGSSSSAQNPSHTYSSAGNYTATLTVNDGKSSSASSSISISVGSISGFSLAIASETGAPAPGPGGTTDPSPGSYSYAVGSSIDVKSVANPDYRFSKWAGDIIEAAMFNTQTTITIDKNKTLSGSFCTKCGDVNGDLKITPADAQAAFDIFLGKISNPTWCEKENADVNSSGSKLNPKVTPADAQVIFSKYLKKGIALGDCSGNSRSATSAAGALGSSSTKLAMNSLSAAPGDDIYVPILVESSSEISAFGFDVLFSSEILTFIGLEKAELTVEYDQLAANVLLPDQTIIEGPNYATLRVGGYETDPTQKPLSGILVVLIFRVTGINEESSPIQITTAYDDIQDALITNGTIALRQQTRENYGQLDREAERKSGRKRYDF
jgi:PKD repeat protein